MTGDDPTDNDRSEAVATDDTSEADGSDVARKDGADDLSTAERTNDHDESGIFGTILASGGILLIGLTVQMGTNFFTRVTVARLLGEADYGAVSLGFAALSTLAILSTGGIDIGIGRFLPRFDAVRKRRGVLVSAYGVALPVSVGIGLTATLTAGLAANRVFGDPSVGPVLTVFGLTVPAAVFVRLTIGSIRGLQKSLPRVIIQNFTLPVSRLGLVITVILLGGSVVAVAWAYTAAYLLAAGLSAYYLFSRTSLFDRVGFEAMHRRLLSFSVPLMVTTGMKLLLSNIDTFAIGVFGTVADVAVYNVAYPLASLLTVALAAFGFVFMPIVSELEADGRDDEFVLTYYVVSKWILVLSLPLLLIAVTFPETVIGLTFGSGYARAAPALIILSVGFFTHAVTGPSGNALTAIGNTRLIMWDTIVVAVVNLVANLLLVPRLGTLGAAVATALSYGLLNSLYLAQLYRATGTHPFRSRTAVPATVAALAWVGFWYGTAPVTAGLGHLLATVGVFVLVYPFLFVAVGGVEEAELRALRALEDRFGVDLSTVRGLLGATVR
jgi:O-antigen/teichoic acid export membrane protein